MKNFLRSLFLSTVTALMCVGQVALPLSGLALATAPLTGCTINPAVVAADGNAIANALFSIANIEAASNPGLAGQLNSAGQGIQTATANWQTGTTTAMINDAAQVVDVVLAAIPATEAIAPLLPIAVAALDLLLGQVQAASPAPTPPANAALSARAKMVNPYRPAKVSDVVRHMPLRSPEGDFKSAWNGTAKKHGLTAAILK